MEHLFWSAPVQALEKDPGSALLPGEQTTRGIQLVVDAVEELEQRGLGGGAAQGRGVVKRRPKRREGADHVPTGCGGGEGCQVEGTASAKVLR